MFRTRMVKSGPAAAFRMPQMELVMKFVLPFVAVLAVGFAGAGTAVAAATVDYTRICNSSRLLASDRHDCRVQMTAATSQAQQAQIYRIYDAKIASLNDATTGR